MSEQRRNLASHFEPLLEKYPVALGNVYCGADCEVGWLNIVEPVIAICEATGVPIHQIKEKFGGLRIYPAHYTENIRQAIETAETQALKTCERCGDPGTKRPNSWIKVLCDECQADYVLSRQTGDWGWWNKTYDE